MNIIKKYNYYAGWAGGVIGTIITIILLLNNSIKSHTSLESFGIIFIVLVSYALFAFICGWLFADLEIEK